MARKKSGKEGKSVLEDKQKFQQSAAAEKLAHMGDKPATARRRPPGRKTDRPEK